MLDICAVCHPGKGLHPPSLGLNNRDPVSPRVGLGSRTPVTSTSVCDRLSLPGTVGIQRKECRGHYQAQDKSWQKTESMQHLYLTLGKKLLSKCLSSLTSQFSPKAVEAAAPGGEGGYPQQEARCSWRIMGRARMELNSGACHFINIKALGAQARFITIVRTRRGVSPLGRHTAEPMCELQHD